MKGAKREQCVGAAEEDMEEQVYEWLTEFWV